MDGYRFRYNSDLWRHLVSKKAKISGEFCAYCGKRVGALVRLNTTMIPSYDDLKWRLAWHLRESHESVFFELLLCDKIYNKTTK